MTASTTTTTAPAPVRHRWVPYAAVAAGVSLLLHAALVIGSGDEISDAVTVTLYLGGMVVALVAAVGAGLRLSGRWRVAAVVGLPLLLVAWAMGIGDLLTPVFEAVKDEEYVGDAGPIGLLGLVLLLLGARARSTR